MKTIIKRIIVCTLIFVSTFALVSCSKEESKDIFAETLTTFASLVDANNVTENLTLPNKIGDVNITYLSTDTAVVANDGTVTRGLIDKKVTLYLNMTDASGNAKILTIDLIVKAKSSEQKDAKSIKVTLDSTEIASGDEVGLTVTVSGVTNKAYTWSVSKDVIEITDTDTVKVIKDVSVDTSVTITATLVEDTSVKTTVSITVKAPITPGKVGELTSEMIAEIANPSITVTGLITDVYDDYNQAFNSSRNEYDMVVKMADGRWMGSWNYKNDDNVVTDIYQRGTEIATDAYGVTGHVLERLYVNKNNVAGAEVIKNYVSVKTVWEAQHLWNHLGNLDVNKFKYNESAQAYEYDVDVTSEESLYLMTYLSYSLTPLLEDTLDKIFLFVENGHITRIEAQTEVITYGGTTDTTTGITSDYDSASYTTVELVLSDIGTTVVEDPASFEAPLHVDALQTALDYMKTATNYTFHAVETDTVNPSYDESDYSYTESVGSKNKVHNNTSATGTVGLYGLVTKDAILLAETGEYTQSLDGNNFHTSYSGYKQVDESHFDQCSCNNEGTMYGTKQFAGLMTSILPGFDFSANIFEYVGSNTNKGVTYYTFKLRESSIMRDVALETSMHSYADDASASSYSTFKIVVTSDGKLSSITYPYSLVGGTWMGYITTTYSNFGTTEIDADVFEGYEPRVLKMDWNEYIVKYYSETFSSKDSHEESAAVVLQAIYGDDYDLLPPPSLFFNLVGDNFYGPFFDDVTVGTDLEGNPIKHGLISITVKTDYADENQQMSDEDYYKLIEDFKDALAEYDFTYSQALSEEGKRNLTRVTFVKSNDTMDSGIEIVIENNGTRYLWIYFYILGDWSPRTAE